MKPRVNLCERLSKKVLVKMEKIGPETEKAILEYPCDWQYKVIGKDEKIVREVIAKLLSYKSILLKISQQSTQKKYLSLNLDLIVNSEEERDQIYQLLKEQDEIVMVL